LNIQSIVIILVFILTSGISATTSFFYEAGYNQGTSNTLVLTHLVNSNEVWVTGPKAGQPVGMVMGPDSLYPADPGQGYSLSCGWYIPTFWQWNRSSVMGIIIPLRLEQYFGKDVSDLNLNAMLKMEYLWMFEGGFGLGLSCYSMRDMPKVRDSVNNEIPIVKPSSFAIDGILNVGFHIPICKRFHVGMNWYFTTGLTDLHWERASYEIFLRVFPK
jgi:hypothetical protein